MIAQITIRNFRSIKEVVFPLRNGLNVIVGANGSGKTNLLHALKFLSNVVTSGASLAMAKAGGPARNFRRGENSIQFSVESFLDASLFGGRQTQFFFVWDLTVAPSGPDGFVQVWNEVFRVEARPAGGVTTVMAAEIARGSSGQVRTKFRFAEEDLLTKRLFESSWWANRSSRKSELFASIRRNLEEILSGVKKRPHDASMLEQLSYLHDSTRRLYRSVLSLDEYNIAPESARQAVDPLPVIRMGSDGAGVSEVIGALESEQYKRLMNMGMFAFNSPYVARYPYEIAWGNRNKKNPLPDILEQLKSAVSSIDGIGTEIDPSTGRRFIVFKSQGEKFRPQEVSDGTFKWLCLLVALYVPASQVMLLEEPENFMHPWMQQRFVDLARVQSKKNFGSVVLSTHSATVLNSLTTDELRVCHQLEGETKIECVKNGEEIDRILRDSSFGLGDMWVSGEFGGVTGGF